MPTGLVTVSQYTAEPPVQIDPTSEFEVRGWYTRDFIAGDGVTPVYGNATSGNEGPYYDVDSTLNADGELVVPAHEIQATTLSNPTANYFEGLWVDGAFVQMLMPNTNVATGWQIPTVYGTPIAIDEIALYNRAKRLLYPPDTYPTFDEVVLLIQRLAGNFDYMAVDVNGIGSASFPPVTASDPIVLMENDPKVGSWSNIIAYFADTASSAAANAVAIANAVTAAASAGRALYIPAGTFNTNSVTISVPCIYAPGGILKPASGQTVNHASTVIADPTQHFDISAGGAVLLTGAVPEIYPQWYGADQTGVADATAEFQAMIDGIPSTGGTVRLTARSIFSFSEKLLVATNNITWSGYGATMLYDGGTSERILSLLANDNTFEGITFSGNNAQPWCCLVYVDDDVQNAKFIDCTFKDISVETHGSDGTNQVYGVSLSPYGVTDFLFRNCLFYNLTSDNTALDCFDDPTDPLRPTPCEGVGFVGGIVFIKLNGTGASEGFNNGSAAQDVIPSGLVEGCTFDTIKTILPAPPEMSDTDLLLFDDGDAIRSGGTGVGYDATGVNQINLRVSNCRFTNVSKRAVKFSGVSGLTMIGNEVIADQGAYSMSEVVKTYGNAIIDGLKIRTPGKVVSSLTLSGTIARAVVASHGYVTGNLIAVIGATQPEYNGRYSITRIDDNTFDFTIVPGTSLTSPATGTIRSTLSPLKGIQCEALQNVVISNVAMESGGYFVLFTDAASPTPAQRNLVISNFACDNLFDGGISHSTDNPVSAYGLTIADGYLGCTAHITTIGGAGLVLPVSGVGADQGEWSVYNVKVRNGSVRIAGQNNIIDGLTMIVDRAGFNSPSGTGSLLGLGGTGANQYNVFRNIIIDISKILDTYLTGRTFGLAFFAGDNSTTQNLSIRVPYVGDYDLSTAASHASFWGSDCVVDGVSYFGNGFINLGVAAASNGSVYRNLSRLGYNIAAATRFLITDASAVSYVIQNVSDQRTWTGDTFELVGTPYVLDGVASLSSQFELGGNDSAGTIRNAYRISSIIRKESSFTVDANADAIDTLADTMFLTTSGGPWINCTLTAPTTGDLDLVIQVLPGTLSTAAVIASTTAVFVGAAPTFGLGSGNVGSMTFKSSTVSVGPKWYETARAVVP